MPKKALITGITGQDGGYLAELLLSKGYEVYGAIRRLSVPNTKNVEHIKDRITFVDMDLHDQNSILNAIRKVNPDEVYNLAAQSFVPTSWDQKLLTGDVNGLGVTRILDSILAVNPKIRFYQASTSEMFGKVQEVPQKEDTPFYPRSPYGVAKVYAYWMTVNFRESYDMFACNGILFNHEGPRRGEEFVTRKISKTVAEIKKGKKNVLVLGNLNSKRDWGYVGDYVEAMWLMLQQEKPEDYVIATGETHTVREFVDAAFSTLGLSYTEVDLHDRTPLEADQEIERLKTQEGIYVVMHPKFFRPAEVDLLVGDPTKAKDQLGWVRKVSFNELVGMMVRADYEKC
ncbi:GDP-mannose 4,6-dehydratase [archaeon]|jgi:GDPmannose 4,6-dehydratase|nr:GDP-mannose 4,6-dehydratase [archaeon]MBT4396836.1 GDP-mannose 4,6-dehydratase [archaeon]MBT4441486.1 GDP-mannose 4,6-dehydratase [archaeon]